MSDLPAGLVTFLFTDIEGSTKLWEAHPKEMSVALVKHDSLLRHTAVANGGIVFKTVGDAVCMAFADAANAVAAALSGQLALTSEAWPTPTPINVRMALHTGYCEPRGGDYFGQPLNRVARLLGIAHGKQILLSGATASAVGDRLPAEASTHDRGSHTLKDLEHPEKVFQLTHPGLLAQFPPLRSLSTHPNNLPHQLTSFIAREKEILDAKALLRKTRLLTVAGPGGSGKTRLALQIGADLLESFEDGVWLVELATLTDATLVPQAVAGVFQLKEQAGADHANVVVDYLREKRLLLLLDNCEHLVEACARLVDRLLRQSAYLAILTTSRETLGIAGEVRYVVPPLSMPDPKRDTSAKHLGAYESVRLFVERAQSHLSTFVITDDNAPLLASVCSRLDGIPFAIELAAARTRNMSLSELDQRLDHRFQLLTGGSRAAVPRQQTLRALIDWSYDLLGTTERTLLYRSAVFVGGWTLDAATRVCTDDAVRDWDVLDALTSLSDKSLIVVETHGGEIRYRMLEMVGEYARDRLRESGDDRRVHDKHRDYFLTLAVEAATHFRLPDQQLWLDRLETEHDNLRAALTQSPESSYGVEQRMQLVKALWYFWLVRGYLVEGRRHLAAALASVTPTSDHAAVLLGAGILAYEQGDYGAARPLWEQSLRVSEEAANRIGIARALDALANLAFTQGDYAVARPLYERSIGISREVQDQRAVGMSLSNLGLLVVAQGDLASARTVNEECLVIRRALCDEQGVSISSINLGIVLELQGDLAPAKAMYEESLTIAKRMGNRAGIASAQACLGSLAARQGDYRAARSLLKTSLSVRSDLGDRLGVAKSLESLASVHAGAVDTAQLAASLWGQAEQIRADLRAPMEPGSRPDHARSVSAARALTGDDASFDKAWKTGAAMSLGDAVAYALQDRHGDDGETSPEAMK